MRPHEAREHGATDGSLDVIDTRVRRNSPFGQPVRVPPFYEGTSLNGSQSWAGHSPGARGKGYAANAEAHGGLIQMVVLLFITDAQKGKEPCLLMSRHR